MADAGGAGVGKYMNALVRAGFDVIGVELSPSFIRKARELYGFSTDQLLEKRIEECDFVECSFDFVNLAAVLEHLPQPGRAVEQTMRWLRPDGLAYAEVPSSKWLSNRLGNLFYRITGTSLVCNLSPMYVPFHLYEFSLKCFERHARLAHSSCCQECYPWAPSNRSKVR